MRLPRRAALGLLPLLLLLPPAPKAAKKPTPCQRCRGLVDKFNQGLVDTAKKNFGGGNTAWEEKTLSKYESSEIRLLEILEGLCESSDFECNQMLEAQEEHLEAWWLQLKNEYPDLLEWFCVKTLKVCCSPGTYGPDCLACQGGSQRPCSGNGHCSGDGSRQGDGSCRCHVGYQGPLCTDCMDGYFSSLRNETHSVCTVRTGLSGSYTPCRLSLGCWRGMGHAWIRNTHTQPGYSSRVWIAAFSRLLKIPWSPACDESCKTCSGPTNTDCGECEVGWVLDEGACVDVDECAAETPPCSAAQFCKNANGSYTCEECDSSCVGCTGEGPGNCKECIPGYAREHGQCADVDECSLAEKACVRKNENCYNTPGSYVCVCPDGFEETEDACVPPAEAEATEEESLKQLPTHEDL
ncbi:cysteine-rich with EGF-like domain protein 2 isoform X2 [Rhinopithecus roxellana]|uniref:cysteine-rich with EGF-like domain protein 2 isoform X2 n=1 Tax=Rhinopithecus roxellana TaxID=61622 RepID=UPI00053310EB|nr:cysteine-rich with EGF-like domain protein 2 isoform X2 [Rhinopithecus roxellana]XP_017709580.1 PREDICTED: cysteine-rich with EGF-like domain protein 2 isoform X3 [Rhinopithecus bieti]